MPGSGVGQREPTDTRLKGVLEQGKGPAIRQRRQEGENESRL